jgi:pimeloyl-ACP methyl ester carboxylesterase
MTVKLNYTKFGERNRSLIILHGLFGSSKNWITFARTLSQDLSVYALDLRNHGDSPHTDTHSLDDLREDLKYFIDFHKIEKPILLGHSMGGLAVMALALKYPEIAQSIIIEDIAPRNYVPHHENEFQTLNRDLSKFHSRNEIDEAMSEYIKNKSIRQFLQMNLERMENGYRWKLNIPILEKSTLIEEFAGYEGCTYSGPALFVTGGLSEYVKMNDHTIIQKYFPASEIITIPEADHWLHYSSAEKFLSLVKDFLNQSSRKNQKNI